MASGGQVADVTAVARDDQPPRERRSVGPHPLHRERTDDRKPGGADALRLGPDVVGRQGVRDRAFTCGEEVDELAATRRARLGRVVDGNELEVVEAEAHDRVVRAAPGVATARAGVEAEGPVADDRGIEVAYGDDDVIQPPHR